MIDTSDKNIAEFTADRMRARYIVALSLIAILTIISQWVLQRSLADQEYDSRVVNIAGRQRMLSQRITKTALYLRTWETNEARHEARAQLRKALSLWQQSHLRLQRGDSSLGLPGANSAEVDALFKTIEPDYQAMVASVRDILAEPDSAPASATAVMQLSQHEASFLTGMDAIVFRYDSEAKLKVANARYLEFGLGALTLVVLMLEARLIFAPAVRRMRHDMRRREVYEADLERLFAASPTAMLLVDASNLTIVLGNHKAESLMGCPSGSYLGHPVSEFLDAKFDTNRAFMEKIQANDTLDECEIILLDARQRVVEALASACRIRHADHDSVAIGITDISEIKQAQQTLQYYATFDEMTGLVNRRTGMLMLATELGRADRNLLPLSICFVDLDRLKTINDQFGHHEGDRMIKLLASVLLDSIRGGDVAIHLGGDEFVLVLHDCTEQQAAQLVTRIEQGLEEAAKGKDRPYDVSASFGIARYNPSRHAAPEDLLAEADSRMYEAKNSGEPPLSAPFAPNPVAHQDPPPCTDAPSRIWRPCQPSPLRKRREMAFAGTISVECPYNGVSFGSIVSLVSPCAPRAP